MTTIQARTCYQSDKNLETFAKYKEHKTIRDELKEELARTMEKMSVNDVELRLARKRRFGIIK